MTLSLFIFFVAADMKLKSLLEKRRFKWNKNGKKRRLVHGCEAHPGFLKPRNLIKRKKNPDDLIWRTQLHQLPNSEQTEWVQCVKSSQCARPPWAQQQSSVQSHPPTDAGHEFEGATRARWVCRWLRHPAQVVTKTRTRHVESELVKHESGRGWQGLEWSKHCPFAAMSAIAICPERWLDETSAEKCTHTITECSNGWVTSVGKASLSGSATHWLRWGIISFTVLPQSTVRDALHKAVTSKSHNKWL